MSSPCPLVVMIAYPLQSHITPLLQLAKLLAARGLTVTFVLNNFNMKQIEESKEELRVSELNKMGVKLVGIWDNVLERTEANLMKDFKDVLECLPLLITSFDELVEKMVMEQGLTISCIISDSFLVKTQDVANKWRIPRATFWPNSLTALACYLSVPDILAACWPDLDPFKPHVYVSDEANVLTCIPGVPELDMRNLPFYNMGFEPNETWLRLNSEAQRARVNETLCIICNSYLDFEREVHTQLQEMLPSTPILTLGPLWPSGYLDCQDDPEFKGTAANLLDEDLDCIQWLDTQERASVLYISMGSVLVLPEREIQELALGLEASKQPFLWATRSPPCASPLPYFSSHGQGKVVRWAPQLRVLSHDAVGGFLTHCGWNSTLESISMGKPVIGWPIFMDQITNCWFLVENLKMGVRLQVDKSKMVGHQSVEKSIRMLMQEEEGHLLRARAAHFCATAKASFSTSLPSNLDSLVRIIRTSRTSKSYVNRE